MTRSQRIEPVRKFTNANERREATELADSEARLAQCEAKLDELKQYEQDYRQAFNARVSAGMGGHGVRDYQQFLARLTEAIRQQHGVVLQARRERDAQANLWRDAAQRHKAVDHVVETWRAEERREVERREQRDSDERAQRRTKAD